MQTLIEPEVIPEVSINDIPDEHKEQARDIILRTALELFAERGYAATSTRVIAERAGVSSGLIFHHFKTKSELLKAVLLTRADIFADVFSAFESPDLTFKDFIQRFRNFFLYSLTPNSAVAHHTLLNIEVINLVPEMGQFTHDLSKDFSMMIAAFLKKRVEAGELPADLDTETAARTLQGNVIFILLTHMHCKDNWAETVGPILDDHIAFWQRAISMSQK